MCLALIYTMCYNDFLDSTGNSQNVIYIRIDLPNCVPLESLINTDINRIRMQLLY